MAIVFITDSTDGLGRAAAQSLLDGGHQVVLHARSAQRATAVADLASRSAGIVVGDLCSAAEIRTSQIKSTQSGGGRGHPYCRRLHAAKPRIDAVSMYGASVFTARVPESNIADRMARRVVGTEGEEERIADCRKIVSTAPAAR